jgi:hypothetical protein
MGMLEYRIKTIPEENNSKESKASYIQKISREMDEYLMEENDYESRYTIDNVDESNFEYAWNLQENIINNEETKQKYLERAKAKRLIFIEIDWEQ